MNYEIIYDNVIYEKVLVTLMRYGKSRGVDYPFGRFA
jgi:hypothetical protein